MSAKNSQQLAVLNRIMWERVAALTARLAEASK